MLNSISPLDSRYKKASLQLYKNFTSIFSEDAFIKYCVKVEIALLETIMEFEICPQVKLGRISVEPEEVYKEEEETEHQQAAIVNVLKKKVPEKVKPYVHLFATSFDIVDTARALQLKDFVNNIYTPCAKDFITTLVKLAEKYKDCVQIGRTHGRFAEPVTFGYYIANILERFGRTYQQIRDGAQSLYGKYSGAVGSFSALSLSGKDPLKIEERFLSRLGLCHQPRHISTQIIHPEQITSLLLWLAQAFTILANLSDDMRHLMRSEIDEIIIKKRKKTIGSSTMPHKINPKDFEQIKSLWKKFIPQTITFFMDSISEHQRDLTNSASTRFTGEFLYAISYSLYKLTKVLNNIEFNVKKAQENLEKAKCEIFAEPLYIALALSGEKEPYKLVYEFVNKLRDENILDYISELKKDPRFKKVLENEHFSKAVLEPQAYTGLCSKLVDNVISYWQKELSS